jgi:hypothetical protein
MTSRHDPLTGSHTAQLSSQPVRRALAVNEFTWVQKLMSNSPAVTPSTRSPYPQKPQLMMWMPSITFATPSAASASPLSLPSSEASKRGRLASRDGTNRDGLPHAIAASRREHAPAEAGLSRLQSLSQSVDACARHDSELAAMRQAADRATARADTAEAAKAKTDAALTASEAALLAASTGSGGTRSCDSGAAGKRGGGSPQDKGRPQIRDRCVEGCAREHRARARPK